MFYVPAQEMFRFFVIFQVPVCMPVPHDFWAGLGMDGVVYGVGRPSLTSIFYTPYFASIAVFNIPAWCIFSVFDVFHFTVFFFLVLSLIHKLADNRSSTTSSGMIVGWVPFFSSCIFLQHLSAEYPKDGALTIVFLSPALNSCSKFQD